MTNAVLLVFLAISGIAFYLSRKNSLSFLLIIAAAAVIAYRTEFVFITVRFLIMLAASGFGFYAAGRIFRKISKFLSIISAVVVFVLTLIRIC